MIRVRRLTAHQMARAARLLHLAPAPRPMPTTIATTATYAAGTPVGDCPPEVHDRLTVIGERARHAAHNEPPA